MAKDLPAEMQLGNQRPYTPMSKDNKNKSEKKLDMASKMGKSQTGHGAFPKGKGMKAPMSNPGKFGNGSGMGYKQADSSVSGRAGGMPYKQSNG